MEKPLSLVLAAGSLGDSLLLLPSLRFLEDRSQVTLAGTASYLSLGPELFGVHQMIPLDPLLQKLLAEGPLDSSTLGFLSGFKDLFIFFKERDGKLEAKLSALKNLHLHFPPKDFKDFLLESRWAAEYWMESAAGEALPPDSPYRRAKLNIGDDLRKKGLERLNELGLSSPLVIHPGSGSPDKNAPLSFFRTAAERAGLESQKQVLVLWGEAEEKNIQEIQKTFAGLENTKVASRPYPLRELAGLFSRSAAYLGNDSGITQLASACGLRTFAVFNTTDSRIWGPQANSIVLSMLKGNLY